MKPGKVMKILNISRQTLANYRNSGLLKVDNVVNGRYYYNDESVYAMMSKNARNSVMYCRVSTSSQKSSLATQEEKIRNFCLTNGVVLNKKYEDVSSGMNLERKGFAELLEDIFTYKIDTVFITNRDRLTILSFPTLQEIFLRFGTKIVAIDDLQENLSEEKELLTDIISLVHTFSTRMYSKRRKKKLDLIELYDKDAIAALRDSGRHISELLYEQLLKLIENQ